MADADPAASVSPADLRATMARFAAGVTVVSARWQGLAHAMTATAFCSVSLDPPLVLVCVSRSSRFHAAILGADGWAVSLLAGGQRRLAEHFSRRGRDLLTQFDTVDHHPAPRSGAPLIDGALAWLDCRTETRYDGGDHTIVVGRALATGRAGRAAGSAEESVPGVPLTYYQGTYSPPD